jgi:hypothetical protein
MDEWGKIGMTDRAKRAALEARINKVEEAMAELVAADNRRTDPTAIAHATSVVKSLEDAIANYEKQAAKAKAEGNAAKEKVALEAAAARKSWLEEAKKGLATFDIK